MEQVLDGVVSFVKALATIMSTPSALARCLLHTPLMIACVAASAGLLWVFCYPIRLLKLGGLQWGDALTIASFTACSLHRFVLTFFAHDAFFHSMALFSKEASEDVRKMPPLTTLKKQLFQLLLVLLVCAVVIIGLVASLPVALPIFGAWAAAVAAVVAAGAASVAALGAAGLGICVLVLLFVVVPLGLLGFGFSVFVKPFLVLWSKIDPVLAIGLAVAVAFSSLNVGDVAWAIRIAASLYASCSYLTQQMLGHYSCRLSSKAWTSFKLQHRWQLFGFGLPVWVVMQFHPLVAMTLLDLMQGAAAGLLVDLLQHKGVGLKGE